MRGIRVIHPEWCKKMMDEDKDGEEAMAYFELMNMWKSREDNKCQN